MIVWLNGAFGVGKTATAEAMVRRLPGMAHIVDPERIGWAMRRTFWQGQDYQDVALWETLTRWWIAAAHRRRPSGTVIVPMTVLDESRLGRLAGDAQIFTLTASRATLLERIEAGDQRAREWRTENLDRCLALIAGDRLGMHIATDDRTPGDVAAAIFAAL